MKKFKPSAAQLKQVEAFITKWQPKLFLQMWRINNGYSETPHPTNDLVRASVKCETVYKFADVTLYPRFFSDPAWKQEENILHEMVHCLVEPLDVKIGELLDGKLVTAETRRETIENVTVHVTNVIFSADWYKREEVASLKKRHRKPRKKRSASK